MKNFKFKLNFLLNLFKKIKVIKKINILFENTIKLVKLENLKKNVIDKYHKLYSKYFNINKLLFFF